MALDVRGIAPLLQVYDMPTAVRFYRDVLGFEIVTTSPVLGVDMFHWVLLRLGQAEVMLNTAYEFDHERPAVPDPGRVAGHGDVGLFLSCPDVQAVYDDLHGKGLAINKPNVARYGMKQLCVRDPDGFELCFQWPSGS